MGFIIGEDLNALLQRITYRGCIGIFYNSTIGGILAYILFGLFSLLAVIGLLTALHFLIARKPKAHTSDTSNRAGLTPDERQWLYGKK